MVDGLPSLVVHEEVIEHGAQLGRQTSQKVHHAQPRDADLRPGDVERQQHQEANQRNAWRGGGEAQVIISDQGFNNKQKRRRSNYRTQFWTITFIQRHLFAPFFPLLGWFF